MHIIIGILTLAAALFVAYRRFNEAGLASTLNPFLWFRRRSWQKRRATNPLFILDDSKDVAAALLFIIAKLDGEMTKDSKIALQNDYQQCLGMSESDATATLQQTSFMLEQYPIVRSDLKKILHKDCVMQMSGEQAQQLLSQLELVAQRESPISNDQQQWIADIEKYLQPAYSQTF